MTNNRSTPPELTDETLEKLEQIIQHIVDKRYRELGYVLPHDDEDDEEFIENIIDSFAGKDVDAIWQQFIDTGQIDFRERTPQPRVNPPEFGEYLLWYLPMPPDIREAVIGDLQEEYVCVHQRFGHRRAVVWYYTQVAASFWPFVVSKIRGLGQFISQVWVIDLFRRLIS